MSRRRTRPAPASVGPDWHPTGNKIEKNQVWFQEVANFFLGIRSLHRGNRPAPTPARCRWSGQARASKSRCHADAAFCFGRLDDVRPHKLVIQLPSGQIPKSPEYCKQFHFRCLFCCRLPARLRRLAASAMSAGVRTGNKLARKVRAGGTCHSHIAGRGGDGMIRCGFSVNLPGARNGDRAFSIVLRPTIAIRSGDARGATSKPIAARVGSAFANQVHAAVVPIAPVLSDPAALRKFLELARSASHAPFQRNECQLHQSRRLQAYCRLSAGTPGGLGSPSSSAPFSKGSAR
ncbi:hypothetical protein SAMN03159423_0313 [Bradyrhizobium sp. NFR13]|nr:hypothetical protein SAMN03159423_0313 [Bradyrhizobium sp. NFR13]